MGFQKEIQQRKDTLSEQMGTMEGGAKIAYAGSGAQSMSQVGFSS